MFFRKALAFFKRDLQESLSFRTTVLFEALSVFAQCWVFFYLGKFVEGKWQPPVSEDYFTFLLFGVAFAGYQFTALQSFALAIHREIGAGTLEAILLTRTHPVTLVFSSAFWSFIFTTLKIALWLLVGALFFGLNLGRMNVPLFTAGLAMTVFSLIGLGMLSAAFILVFKRGDPVSWLLNGLTRLFSGIYFPVALLPLWGRKFAEILPLTHSMRIIRAAAEGAPGDGLAPSFMALGVFAAVLIPLGMGAFWLAVKTAKSEGSLAFTD